MASYIVDYINWRGDVDFTYAPVNEIDHYIITKIGALKLEGIIPEDESEITIGEAITAYDLKFGESGSYLGALASPIIVPAIRKLPSTGRFGGLKLSGFRKTFKADNYEQFSALTVGLPDGRHVITFRGTDDTISAWEEDLLMSIEDTVPAQKDALEYLEWAAEHYEGSFIISGHSKGGNLAVFAAASASPELQARIEKVYSFDGPGFGEDFFTAEGYKNIEDRLELIIPQHSVVGTLLNQKKAFTIVKAAHAGMRSHDGFMWETRYGGFVKCRQLSDRGKAFNEAMNTMLANTSMEERKVILKEVFDMLEETGADTVTDLKGGHRLRRDFRLTRSLSKSPEARRFVTELVECLVGEYRSIRREGR